MMSDELKMSEEEFLACPICDNNDENRFDLYKDVQVSEKTSGYHTFNEAIEINLLVCQECGVVRQHGLNKTYSRGLKRNSEIVAQEVRQLSEELDEGT